MSSQRCGRCWPEGDPAAGCSSQLSHPGQQDPLERRGERSQRGDRRMARGQERVEEKTAEAVQQRWVCRKAPAGPSAVSVRSPLKPRRSTGAQRKSPLYSVPWVTSLVAPWLRLCLQCQGCGFDSWSQLRSHMQPGPKPQNWSVNIVTNSVKHWK